MALQAAQAHIAATPGVTNEAAAAFALGYAAALSDGSSGAPSPGGGKRSEDDDAADDAGKQEMAIAARALLKSRRPLRSRSYDSESGSPSVYK